MAVIVPNSSERIAVANGLVNPTWLRFFAELLRLTNGKYDTSGISAGWQTALAQTPTGTYTPTLTNVANLDSSTAYSTGYYQIGDRVTVFGRFDADATAAASTTTQLRMSVPVASAFTQSGQLGGVAAADGSSISATARAETTNDVAEFTWLSNATSNRVFRFSFTYQVL